MYLICLLMHFHVRLRFPDPFALQPIFATVDAVAEFAEQFTRLESENTQLRRTIKTSADQVLEANKLATDAQKENTLLKEELKKLKQKMKDDQDAKRKAATVADEKEGVLRESIANLMGEFFRAYIFLDVFLQASYLSSFRCCRFGHQSSSQASRGFRGRRFVTCCRIQHPSP
jgi:regulator of replication initiation timing